MKITHLLCTVTTVLLLVSLTSGNIYAQDDSHYVYLLGQVGTTYYHGDLAWTNTHQNRFDLGFAGGIGYAFSPVFSLRADYRRGEYPRTERPGVDFSRKHNAALYAVFNLLPTSPVRPYLFGGGGLTYYGTFDGSQRFEPGYGPVAGLGVDVGLSDMFSFFVEGKWDVILDGNAMDNTKAVKEMDVLGFLSGGVRINLRSKFIPIRGVRIGGPATLNEQESGRYTAALIAPATEPISYEWDMGDGTTKLGPAIEHRYTEAGDYTITVVASNKRSEVSRSYNVKVASPAIPARIVSVSADKMRPKIDEAVTFTAEVEGTGPVLYEWVFHDGTTSRELTAQRAYPEPGEYRVEFNADNRAVAGADGVHTRTLTINVQAPELVLPKLGAVHFEINSSALTDRSRETLRENIRLLNENPDVCVTILSYTDATGNAAYNLQLSERRAQAVRDFYLRNGIAERRLRADGRGISPEPCPDGGTSCFENRRVDSIANDCR